MRVFFFNLARDVLSHLPKRLGYRLVSMGADAYYVVSSKRRAIITDNIRRVLGPEAAEGTLKKTVRGVLRNAAKNYYDLVKIPRLKLEDIEQSIKVNNWECLERAIKAGKGVMLVTAHLSSFDMSVQLLAARNIKTTVLVEPLEPPEVHRHFVRLRESKGVTCVPNHPGASKTIIQALRRGEVVAVVCDRDIAGDGMKLQFFGEEATMPLRTIKLAMRTGAAIIPAFTVRLPDGSYEAFIQEPLIIDSPKQEAFLEYVEHVVKAMETYIRRWPDQWVVLSRIWD